MYSIVVEPITCCWSTRNAARACLQENLLKGHFLGYFPAEDSSSILVVHSDSEGIAISLLVCRCRTGQSTDKASKTRSLERGPVQSRLQRKGRRAGGAGDSGQILKARVIGNHVTLPQIEPTPRTVSLDGVKLAADVGTGHDLVFAKLPPLDHAFGGQSHAGNFLASSIVHDSSWIFAPSEFLVWIALVAQGSFQISLAPSSAHQNKGKSITLVHQGCQELE